MSGGALAAKHYLIESVKQINPKVAKKLKGAEGKPGTTGKSGPEGKTGPSGTNATVNGVAAGGDLTGTYPNPTIASGAVSGAKLGAGAVSDSNVSGSAKSVAEAGGTIVGAAFTSQFNRLGGALEVKKTGTGKYEITIPGLKFFYSSEITQITQITMINSTSATSARIDSIGGHLLVIVQDGTGTEVPGDFAFVVYD